jgi:hypothetical protein
VRVLLLINDPEVVSFGGLHILVFPLSFWSHTRCLLNRSQILELVKVVIQGLSVTFSRQGSVISLSKGQHLRLNVQFLTYPWSRTTCLVFHFGFLLILERPFTSLVSETNLMSLSFLCHR